MIKQARAIKKQSYPINCFQKFWKTIYWQHCFLTSRTCLLDLCTELPPNMKRSVYRVSLKLTVKKKRFNSNFLCNSMFVCLFVLFILLTRGTTSDVKHRAIAQIHFRRYGQYHVRLFFYLFF